MGSQRVAATNALDTQPRAPRRAVGFDRLGGIGRTCGYVATSWSSYRCGGPVQADELQQPGFQHQAASTMTLRQCPTSSVWLVIRASGDAVSSRCEVSTSTEPAAASATQCRRRRRIRFRLTAEPNLRPMVNPSLIDSGGGFSTTITRARRGPDRRMIPDLWRRAKSFRRLSAVITRSGGGGPCVGGPAELPDRHGWMRDGGNRVSWLACGCWVGTCV